MQNHLKMDGWKMKFLSGPGLFSGAFAVGFRCTPLKMKVHVDPKSRDNFSKPGVGSGLPVFMFEGSENIISEFRGSIFIIFQQRAIRSTSLRVHLFNLQVIDAPEGIFAMPGPCKMFVPSKWDRVTCMNKSSQNKFNADGGFRAFCEQQQIQRRSLG